MASSVIALPSGRVPVGYEFVRQLLGLSAFEVTRPAVVRPVSRIEEEADHLAVPGHVAPADQNPLSHLLFALKHEGTNLQVLAQALPRLPGELLQAELDARPMGAYVRVLCYLWEHFTGGRLTLPPKIGGGYAPVFPPERYFTGAVRRDARWRVDFNGLGDLSMCATVARTPAMQAHLDARVLERTAEFVEQMPREMIDRALGWAYLAETKSSFAIEREEPSQQRAEAFAQLLQQAHEPRPMSEQYLVELQNATMTNPLSHEVQFRTQQNWLQNGAAGALGVTYLPPPPELVEPLMQSLLGFVNGLAADNLGEGVDPLIRASIAKFGFVFIHPFVDGNGRLSRFLFHYALAQSKALPSGLVLPVSVAMKRHEADYLAALQTFSRPARQRWKVTAAGPGDYAFEFRGDTSIYRYWDATACVEFGMRMAQEALEQDLYAETLFLGRYDRLARAVNARIDAPNPAIAQLVSGALEQEGRVSKNLRKKYRDVLRAQDFDAIEELARREFGQDAGDEPEAAAYKPPRA